MYKREKILLIDFSKVVSPIGISRHLSTGLAEFVELSKDEIRDMYKKHIGALVKGEYHISLFIDEISPYLKPGYSKTDLMDVCKKVPTLDMNFLEGIKILKNTYYVYLASDLHEVLGNVLRNELKEYFDDFIFSFEEKTKKSEDIYRQNLQKKIDFSKVELFVDDKKEHVDLASKYGIKGLIYDESQGVESVISHVYSHKDYCILGAGAAGIIFSYNLLKYTKKSFCLIEKQPYPYGLMKSFKLSNSWYDLGGHALHDHDKKIIKYLHEEGEMTSYRQKRQAYIDYEGQYIPFPFQLHLSYLPYKEKISCIFDFLKSYCKSNLSKKTPQDLKSFLENSFGTSICNKFLVPYNEKLWKLDLDKISCNWSDRIPFESVKKIVKGFLKKDDENYGSNSYVNYPENGGFQNYLSKFFEKIKEYVNLSCEIIKIDTKYHIIYTNNQIFHYGNLISTIPLNELLELSDINYEKDLFKYLSIQIFSVVLEKIQESKQRIYIKDKKYYFHKCVLNSNSSLSLKNQNESIIQFEATFTEKKHIKKQEFEKNCINYLKNKGFIKNLENIIAKDYNEVEYGYPIQTLDVVSKKDYYINQLRENNIFTLGRFGSWEYCNLGDIIHKANVLFNTLENENFIF